MSVLIATHGPRAKEYGLSTVLVLLHWPKPAMLQNAEVKAIALLAGNV